MARVANSFCLFISFILYLFLHLCFTRILNSDLFPFGVWAQEWARSTQDSNALRCVDCEPMVLIPVRRTERERAVWPAEPILQQLCFSVAAVWFGPSCISNSTTSKYDISYTEVMKRCGGETD